VSEIASGPTPDAISADRSVGTWSIATEVTETHLSILFFVGERVYKLRKPVDFGFVDFTRRQARQEDCTREVTLNRRLAPDVFIGVADVLIDGEAVDHMVVMRRMPKDRQLATLARRGDDLGVWLTQVAQTIVAFHRRAERSSEISAAATGAALRAVWDANASESAPFLSSILDAELDGELQELADRWLSGRVRLFDARIASGKVCDGHGDLQAEDIFCLDDGVRILDCLEFSDRLRFGDVCADVAFLAMDLERLGRSDAARQFLEQYRELADDQFPESLLHYYVALRAYVRAKVACLRVQQGDEASRAQARQLHQLALDHLRRAQVTVVLIGGLPGSGKSTIATGLAHIRGWRLISSDGVRQEMFRGQHVTSAFGTGTYAPEVTSAVYAELLSQAEDLLATGESVVLDASWIDSARREEARVMASAGKSNLIELCCRVHSDTAQDRIVRRLAVGGDPSEATPEVRQAMSEAMDPWSSSIVIDTTGATAEESIGKVGRIVAEKSM
jgi:aminoglycoside phosphotransferase family enzyme/predicted kinase